MRIYVYKILILCVSLFFLYHLTIGNTIYSFQNKFYSSIDKKTVGDVKNKIRNELKNSLKKDRILDKDDALLLNKLFKKINSEIQNVD